MTNASPKEEETVGDDRSTTRSQESDNRDDLEKNTNSSDASDFSATAATQPTDSSSHGKAKEQPGTSITVVDDLEKYYGSTLEFKVDSFIASHPVVMFTKTWCLFSLDAQQFLLKEVKVSIHVIEIDRHPQGKAILKYVQAMTEHRTVPIIFVRGNFLGGFTDVNDLYSTGRLQSDYLADLTHGDRCEEFIRKSNLDASEALFWHPSTVDTHVARVTACLTSFVSLISVVAAQFHDWGHYVAYGLFFDYFLRFIGGFRAAPLGLLANLLTSWMEPKPRHGRPKQFVAFCCGIFVGVASLFFLLNFENSNYVGTAIMGYMVFGSGMEGFFDYCTGCIIFEYGVKSGIIRK